MTPLRRVSALALLVVFATAGTGLPMCLSLLLQATQPCAMHDEHQGGPGNHGSHTGNQVAAASTDQPCHPDDGGAGCNTGGVCPSGGVAPPSGGVVAPALVAQVAADPLTPDTWHLSFSAPPLSPPPQA
ncbi:MAG: hypothetical protein ACREL9_11180 [Gemmatimonadales bacterium]